MENTMPGIGEFAGSPLEGVSFSPKAHRPMGTRTSRRRPAAMLTIAMAAASLAPMAARAAYIGSGSFTRITAAADLTAGYYVFVGGATSLAMASSRLATVSTAALSAQGVSTASSRVTNPSAGLVWRVGRESASTSRIIIYNEAGSFYVGHAGSANNGVIANAALSSDVFRWTYASTASSRFLIRNVASTLRMLQYNSGNPRFAAYSSTQVHPEVYKLNLKAFDIAANYAGSWANGNNAGVGFGAWSIATGGGGSKGVYVGNPGDKGLAGMVNPGFGMYAHSDSGAYVNADRSFSSAMSVGDKFTFKWAFNWDCGSSGNKGFNLYVGGTEVVNINNGNSSAITVCGTNTSFGYGVNAMTWEITYTNSTTLHITANDRDGSGTYTTTITVGGAPTAFRFYMSGQGDNNGNREPFFDDLMIYPAPPAAPTVTSSAASSIAATSATLGGNVTADGGATVTDRGVVYKTSAGVTISDNKTGIGSGTGSFSQSIGSLSVNTRYYHRAYAINSVGTTLGSELNFWTLANVPSAPTVNGATASSLDVTINVNGNPASTEFAIRVGSQYVQANGTLGASAVWQNAATWGSPRTVTGLAESTMYTFDVKARNGANTETAFGSSANGTTLAAGTAPSVTSASASSIAATSATLGGNVTADGGLTVTNRGVVYKTSAGVTIADNKTQIGSGTGSFSQSIGSLSVNTHYYHRAYAQNAAGTTLGTELDFWTLANAPAAPTLSSPNTGGFSVVVNENSNPASTEFAIRVGSQYVQAGGTLGASAVWQTKATWGTRTVTGLSPNTQYTVDVKARNGASTETAFGSSASIWTLANVPAAPTLSSPTSSGFSVAVNENSNPSGTEFAIRVGSQYVQADGTLGASAVWQTKAAWGTRTVTGLSLNTQYTVDVKARNGTSGTPGTETAFGSSANIYTLAAVPAAPTVDDPTTTTLDVTVNANGNPAATTFAIQVGGSQYVQANGSLGGSAVWQAAATWGTITVTGLSAGTQYSFTVKARNGDSTETSFSSATALYTCPLAPASVWASLTNSTDFTASWSAATGATGYRLDVSTNENFGGGASVNLMSNAGFETGNSTGWNKFETEYSVVTTDPYAGTYHVACSATATRDLMQQVAITGDGSKEFEISYWYKGTGNVRIWATWSTGGQVSGDNLTPTTYNGNAASWTKMTYAVVPQNGNNVLDYEVRVYNGASIYLDNFFVGEAGGGGTPDYVPGYSNRTVAGTSEAVTNLAMSTKYYFRVRTEGSSCTSTNSATTNVTTVAGTPYIALADNGSPVGAGSVAAASLNNVLHKFQLTVTNVGTTLTGVSFTSAGTYAAGDLANFKVWYSANSTFEAGSDTELGTISSSLGTGSHSLSSLAQGLGAGSTHYFFITADLSSVAEQGKTINISAFTTANVTVSSGTKTGSTDAGGSQAITAALAISNAGTPAAGYHVPSATDAVLFGFQLSITGTVNFTALTLTAGGTATSSDLSAFRVIYDVNNNGTYESGTDVVASSTNAHGATIGFTMYQNAINGTRKYLVIANVAASPTAGRTFTGSIAAASDVTTTGTESGTAAGNTQTILTLPVLTSPTATGIDQTTATLGANVTTNGGMVLGSRGTVWGTATNPTGNALAEGGTAQGVFTHARSGLTQGTKYFYRGWASNNAGVAYSPNGTFHTEPGQASNVQFANVDATTMRITWSAGASADGAIVVVRAGSSTVDDPVDGTLHGASATYGSAALGSSYVVYRGEGATQVDVTGLSAATTYYVEVFAYKGTLADSGVDQGINYRTTSPATGNQTTLGAEPASSPNNLSFTSVGTSGMTINWGNISTQVLVVVRAASDLSADPVDATTYTADSNFGGSGTALGGGKVVYKGNGASIAVTGLSPDVLYYVRVYNFNGGGGTENYRTSDELAGSQITLATEPAASPTGLSFTSIGTSGLTINWAGGSVSTQVLVVVRGTNALTADPADAATYTASATYGSGTPLGGGYVVYKGNGTSIAVTGLSPDVLYYVRVYNFNGGGGSENYFTTPLAGSQTTLATEPTTHASSLSFTAVGSEQMTVNWTVGNGASRIVIVKQGSAVDWSGPTDGALPGGTISANFGSATDQGGTGNRVCYNGSGNNFTLTGLSPTTTYYVKIIEYNGSGASINYYTGGSPLAGSQATTAAACVPDKVTFVQQDGYYSIYESAADVYNNGTTEVGMWANNDWGGGGDKQAVAWRSFKTDGSGGGDPRELQPGDRFLISVHGYSPHGILGASLNDGASTGSWANRHSNTRGYIQCGNTNGDLYVTYNGGASAWSGIRPWNTTITMQFDILSTREFTANIVGQTPRYDLSMLNSPDDTARVDGYSIYYWDDWNGTSHQIAYWKQDTTLTNLGVVEVGGGSTTNTIYGKITDGNNPKCPDTASPNYLRKTGAGIVTLNNTNTYTWHTEIANGTLNIPRDSALGTPPGSVSNAHIRMAAWTALVGTDSFTLNANRGISLTGGLVYLAVEDNKTVTYNGVINDGANDYGFIKNKGGELVLGGANTYDGGTYHDKGTLTVSNANALGTAKLDLGKGSGANSDAATLKLALADMTLANSITVKTNGTGVKMIQAVESATLSGAITNQVTSDDRFTLDVASGKTLTLSGVISGLGTGEITKTGAGTLLMSNANNSHSNKVTIDAGVVSVAASRHLGADLAANLASKITLNGGTLKATASFTLSQYYSTTLGAGNGFIEVDPTYTLTWPAAISGSGAFGKLGNGTLKLTGANTFSGPVTNSAGILQIGDNGTVGSLTANIANNAALVWHRSDSPSYSGAISGTGTLEKKGAGTLTLSGNNSYTGATTVTEGTLTISHANALGTGAGKTTVADGAQLRLSGVGTAEALILNGQGPSSGGALNNAGGGNTVSGAITLGGAARINSDSSILTLTGGISGGYALTIGGGQNTTVNSVIGNVTSIAKDGGGTLTLPSGHTHTFNGTATVSAGILTNHASAATMAVSVSASGTLSGSGTNGAVTVAGTIDPATGAGAVGKLTTGSLGLSAGGAMRVDVSAATGAAGTGWDSIAAGAITANGTGTFTLNLYGTPGDFSPEAGYAWTIMSGSSVSSFDAGRFAVNTNNFLADQDGGGFSVANVGNTIVLVFTPRQPAVPQNFWVSATNLTSLDLSFTRNANLDPVIIVYDLDGSFGTPSGTPPALDAAFAGGTVVYKGGTSPTTHTPLDACRTYHYKAWSYKGTNYSATGLTDSETTLTPAAPATIWASATNDVNFTAEWAASSGASGYRLDVSTNSDFQVPGGAVDIISQETMGTYDVNGETIAVHESNNRFVNTALTMSGTGDMRDTSASSGYTGASGANNVMFNAYTEYFQISGIDTSGYTGLAMTFGMKLGISSADNDEIKVEYSTNGTDWSDLPFTCSATTSWQLISPTGTIPASSTLSLRIRRTSTGTSSWDFRIDDVTLTGSGSAVPSYVNAYSNRAVAGTSVAVTGLTSGVQYWFRVRPEGAGGCTGANSSTATVTTIVTPSILLADNSTQVAAAYVEAGKTNHVLHQFQLGVTVANTILTNVSFTTAGSYVAADITNLTVWYSANATWDGADTKLHTFSAGLGSGTKTTALLNQTINSGSTGYIFITADIAPAPTYGNTISVNAVGTGDVLFSAGSKSGSTTAGGAQTIIGKEPTTHASALVFSAIGMTNMTISWTPGNGANRIVVVREAGAVSWTPTDLVAITGVDANYALAGDKGSGNKIAYNGSGSSFTLIGLNPGVLYYVKIFEYGGTGAYVNFYTGGTPLAGSESTLCSAVPTGLHASHTNYTAFTSAWSTVSGATGYRLDVSTSATFGSGAGSVLAENFDTLTTTTPPAGWSSSSGSDLSYSSVPYYGNASPSYKFSTSGQSLTSPAFSTGATNLQFWAYGNGGSGSTLAVSGLVSSVWTLVDTANIAQNGATYNVPLDAQTTQIKFYFTKSVNVALDDVVVQSATGDYVGGYSNRQVSGGATISQVVTGLTEGTTYYFRLRSETATCTSGNSSTSSVTTLIDLATEPTLQATNLVLNTRATNSLAVGWSNGNGANRIVVVTEYDAAGLWLFDEGSGATARDSTVNTNHGTLYNTPAWSSRGGAGAIDFDRASTEYVEVLNDFALYTTNSQTISLWLKPESFPGRQNPWNKAYGGEGTITLEPAQNLSYFFGAYGGDGGAYDYAPSIGTLTAGQWKHLVVVRDMDADKMRWYFNGALVSESNIVNNTSYAKASAANLVFGNGYAGALNGEISEPMLLGRALTATEVTNLYAMGSLGLGWVPTDGIAPTGVNSIFPSATDQGFNSKIVYNGSGSSVTVTGLKTNTAYRFRVFEYNGSAATINYLTTTASTNPATFSTYDHRPAIGLGPSTLSPSAYVGSTPSAGAFTVTNLGGGRMEYAVLTNQAWLSVAPASASGLRACQTQAHTVSYNTAGMTAGVYTATITVTNTGTGQNYATNGNKTVSVTLTLTALPNPTAQTATADGKTMVRLAWLTNATFNNVMIVYKQDSATATPPAQNTIYTAGGACGDGIVIYKGTGTNLEHVVSPGVSHYYAFYTVNNNHYSSGVTASTSTTSFASGEIVETFSYTNSTALTGCNGLNGWGGAWFGDTTVATNKKGSFAPQTNYPTPSGNKLFMRPPSDTSQAVFRPLGQVYNSGRIYFGYILNYEYPGAGKYAGLSLFWTNTSEKLFIGEISAEDQRLGIDTTSSSPTYTLTAGSGNDYVIVGYYDWAAGVAKASAFKIGTAAVPEEEPAVWDVTVSKASNTVGWVNAIRLATGASSGTPGETYFDEVRIGTTWGELIGQGPTKVIYDGFAGSSGSISGMGGGTGWGSSTWQLNGDPYVNYESGSFAQNKSSCFPPTGNKIVMYGDVDGRWMGARRDFGTNFNSGAVYVSWLMNYEHAGQDKWAGLRLLDNGVEKAFIGKHSNTTQRIGIGDSTANAQGTAEILSGSGNDYMIVAKYDFNSRILAATSYKISEDSVAEEPNGYWHVQTTQTAGHISSLTGIRLSAGANNNGVQIGDVYMDEVRVGTNWYEVTRQAGVLQAAAMAAGPVPEIIYVGTNNFQNVTLTGTTNDLTVTDADLVNAEKKLTLAVRWTDPQGVFLTNANPAITNYGSRAGRVNPNFDPAVSNLNEIVSIDKDAFFTNFFGINGSTVVTTYVNKAVTIDVDEAGAWDSTYYMTLSSEDNNTAGGTFTAFNSGDAIPYWRALTVNTNVQFYVRDDDPDGPEIVTLTIDGVGGDGSSNLLAGAIAIIGVNGSSAFDHTFTNLTHESFSFVVLSPFPAGTTLWFTDCGWDANSNTNWWDTNEFHLASWTATGSGDVGSTFTLPLPDINAGGDQVALYQYKGTGNPQTDPTNCTFIYAINIDGTSAGYPGWYAGVPPPPGPGDNEYSGLYRGLSNNWSAVSVTSTTVNVYYSGGTTGTASWLLQQISNPTNWVNNLTKETDYDYINDYIPPFSVTGAGSFPWVMPDLSDGQVRHGNYVVTNIVRDTYSGLLASNAAFAPAPYFVLYNTSAQVVVSNAFFTAYTNGANYVLGVTNLITNNMIQGDYDLITLGTNEILVTAWDADNDRTGDALFASNQLTVNVYDDDQNPPAVAFTNIVGSGSKDYTTNSGEILFYDFGPDEENLNLQPTRAYISVQSVADVTKNAVAAGSATGESGAGAAVGSTRWNTDTNYWEFAITMQPGFSLNLLNIRFRSRCTATGPTNWALRCSGDTYGSDLASGRLATNGAWETITSTLGTSSNSGTVTYRLYGSGALNPSPAAWNIDTLSMTGKVATVAGAYVVTDSDLNTNGVAFWGSVQDTNSGVFGIADATRKPTFDLKSPAGTLSANRTFGVGPADGAAKAAAVSMVSTGGFTGTKADIVLGIYTTVVRAVDFDDDRYGDTLATATTNTLTVIDDDAEPPRFTLSTAYRKFDGKTGAESTNTAVAVTDGDLVNGLSISTRVYDVRSGLIAASNRFRVQSPDGWDSGQVEFATHPGDGGARTSAYDAATTSVATNGFDVHLNDGLGRELGMWTNTFYAADYDDDRTGDNLATNQVVPMYVIDDDVRGPRMTNLQSMGTSGTLIYSGFETTDGWAPHATGSWTQNVNGADWIVSNAYVQTTDGRTPDNTGNLGYHFGFNAVHAALEFPPVDKPGWVIVWARTSSGSTAQWVLERFSGSAWTAIGTARTVTETNYLEHAWLVDSTNNAVRLRLRMTQVGNSIYFDDLFVLPYRAWTNSDVTLAWDASTDVPTGDSGIREYRVVPPRGGTPFDADADGVSAGVNLASNFPTERDAQGVVTGYVFAVDADEDRGTRDRSMGVAVPYVNRLDIVPPTVVPMLENGASTEDVDDPTTQFDIRWSTTSIGPDDPTKTAVYPTWGGGSRNLLSPWKTYKIYYGTFEPMDLPPSDYPWGDARAYIYTNFISNAVYKTWSNVTATSTITDPSVVGTTNYLALTNFNQPKIRLYDLDFDRDYAVVIVGVDEAGNESEAGVASWATNNTIKFAVTRGWTVSKAVVSNAFPNITNMVNDNVDNAAALAWIASGPTNAQGVYTNVTKDYDLIYWDSPRFQESTNNNWKLVGTIRTNWFVDDGGQFKDRGKIRFYRASYKDRWKKTRLSGTNVVPQRPLASEEVYALHNVILSGGQNFVALHGVPYSNSFAGVFGGRENFPGGSIGSPASGSTVIEFYSSGTNASSITTNTYWLTTSGQWMQFGDGNVTTNIMPADFFTRGFSITLPDLSDPAMAEYATTTAYDYNQLDQNGSPIQVPAMVWSPILQLPTNGFSQTIYTGGQTGRVATLVYNVVALRLPVEAHPSEMNLWQSGFTYGARGFSDEIYTMNTATKAVLAGSTIYCDPDKVWRFSANNNLVPAGYFKPNDVIVIVSRNSPQGGEGNTWVWTYNPTSFYALPTRWMGH